MPLGKHGDYSIRYFRNDSTLTKQFLIRIIKGNPKYTPYLPDNAKLENITKDLLFSVSNFLIFLVDSLHRARSI